MWNSYFLCWLSVFFVAVLETELRTSHMLAKYTMAKQIYSSFSFLRKGPCFPSSPSLILWLSCPGFLSSWGDGPVILDQLNSVTVRKWFFSQIFFDIWNIINTNFKPHLLSIFSHNWSECFSLNISSLGFNDNVWWDDSGTTESSGQHSPNYKLWSLNI